MMRRAPEPAPARAPTRARSSAAALAGLALCCLAAAAGACSSTSERDTLEERRAVWGGVLEEAVRMAAQDRPTAGPPADRPAVVAAVVDLGERVRKAVSARLTAARQDGRLDPERPDEAVLLAGELAAQGLAEVLFGPGGLRGDPGDPEALSRERFDIDRVLATRQGTCLATVVIGLAAAEVAGLEVAPVLTPGHAMIAVSPGFVVDPATGGVALPRRESRPASRAELLGDLYANRASYRLQAGDVAGARADGDRAVELAPELGTAWINRAVVLLEVGETETAMRDLERVEAIGQGSAASAFNLALGAARLGAMGVAKHWYRVATERDPTSVRAWVNRAALHEALGEPVAARAAYERALAIDPQNGAARERLERLR